MSKPGQAHLEPEMVAIDANLLFDTCDGILAATTSFLMDLEYMASSRAKDQAATADARQAAAKITKLVRALEVAAGRTSAGDPPSGSHLTVPGR